MSRQRVGIALALVASMLNDLVRCDEAQDYIETGGAAQVLVMPPGARGHEERSK